MASRHDFLTIVIAVALTSTVVGQVDTDGDGLLDLIDVPGFDPNAREVVSFYDKGIQDLEGVTLLRHARRLDLASNQISGVEAGDFAGLDNLGSLSLGPTRSPRWQRTVFKD